MNDNNLFQKIFFFHLHNFFYVQINQIFYFNQVIVQSVE